MDADAQFARAGQLMQRGQAEEAATVLQEIVNAQPTHYRALCGLAQIAMQSRRPDIAQHFATRAAATNPNGFEALALLAPAAQATQDFPVAIDAMRSLTQIQPENDRAHYNLGVLLEQAGDSAEAARSYERAIERNPDHLDARSNLCMIELSGDSEVAIDQIVEIVARKRGRPGPPGEHPPELPNDEQVTSRFKIRMDLEQLTYLKATDRLPESLASLPTALEAVLDDLANEDELTSFPVRHPRHGWKSHWQTMAEHHNRPLFSPSIVLPDGPLINPGLDRKMIEQQYFDSDPQHVVVDDLLTEAALDAVLEFCRSATIWYDVRQNYLGAYLTEGFGNALTIGIAKALAEALPAIFAAHPLTQAWGYKYGPALSGIGMHADAAAVNCNFWIAPDSANLDPNHGGLRIFKRQAPLEWDFDTFNNDEAAMKKHLGEDLDTPVIVPHRQNRMAIFNSNLIHQTDRIQFGDRFEDRRYNITLL
ncbi:MAG: tetratricopeptide repeat protein, partial [Pseudomonadota bacterium]